MSGFPPAFVANRERLRRAGVGNLAARTH